MGEDDLGPGACRATALEMNADHSRAQFDGPWGSVEVRLPLVGRHNVFNMLQAIAAANAVAPLARTVRDAVASSPPVPGRLEPVEVPGRSGGPTVLVDYAHTHDALENVLLALRPVVKGRLIVVFGCGGDRDRGKRPQMGAFARALADVAVVTSDNPRSEDPEAIIDEIAAGIPETTSAQVERFVDRRQAVENALQRARPGDCVLIAGKGHEREQVFADRVVPFDDVEVAGSWLRARFDLPIGHESYGGAS
jgi:UDP-N-acetylmuramoyl-L-alanyl-D-glutamate--2,6-diaminopimelate ligase